MGDSQGPARKYRTLSCGVNPEVYDQYQALIPDGTPMHEHLAGLVEQWITSSALADTFHDEPSADPMVLMDLAPVDLGACLHPRGALQRTGHRVECTLCGRDVTAVRV